jgi:hypothetical protein
VQLQANPEHVNLFILLSQIPENIKAFWFVIPTRPKIEKSAFNAGENT